MHQFIHLFSFSSAPVNLEQGNSGFLKPHDLLPLLWSPFLFSLIDQWVFSWLHSHLVFFEFLLGCVCVEMLFTPLVNMSDVAGLYRLLPAENIYHCSYPMAASYLFTQFNPSGNFFFFSEP